MRGFEENNCRLCQKVFCCKKCRIKHETNFHKVFPDCDICIYGRFILENPDEPYLQHLRSSHIPLNCVYCKKIFPSIEEVIEHKKCLILQQKNDSPKTPFHQGSPAIVVSATDQDSPILQELHRKEPLNYIFNLATSTPMQKGQETNVMFDKSKELLTPVDDKSKLINKTNKSIIKKAESFKSDNSSKRRVTFGETPTTNNKISEDKNVASTEAATFSDEKLSDTHTPVTGMSTGQFYSAKSEIELFSSAKTDVFSSDGKEVNAVPMPEGFTPVCVPNMPKGIAKGNIYKTQNSETTQPSNSEDQKISTSEDFTNKSQDSHLVELSMEICTPAGPSLFPKGKANHSPTEHHEEPCASTTKSYEDDSELSIPSCTPANHSKATIKSPIYKNSNPPVISPSPEIIQIDESYSPDSSDKENKCEKDCDNKEPKPDDENDGNTLWLSAVNLDDTKDSEKQSNVNQKPDAGNQLQPTRAPDVPESPPKSSTRRVSIVMPTPVLKRTDVKMKFQIPANFSSTPIMATRVMKLKQTKIVEEISAKVIKQQTPFKTPQGKFSGFTQGRFMRSSLETVSDIVAGPSSSHNGSVSFHENNETNTCRGITTYNNSNTENQDLSCNPVTGVSVSSMTESTLWTSMTRIVKSVLGGFTSMGQESNFSIANKSSSFKRHLSDSDSSGDFLEAPRLKRFKFTDIKCRKPIRNLPALEIPRRLTSTNGQVATFEIVKSVSTLYGCPIMKMKCDKATQTDDYLMYGWHPKI